MIYCPAVYHFFCLVLNQLYRKGMAFAEAFHVIRGFRMVLKSGKKACKEKNNYIFAADLPDYRNRQTSVFLL